MPAAPSAPHLPHGLGNRAMVALVGFLLMLQAVSTDLYLASLPGLTRTFSASIATVQLTLSAWVAAFGTMQLVAGPVSDRFGRRRVLTAGLGLYIAASIACALAPSIDVLIATFCIDENMVLLHNDRDFATIAKLRSLKHVQFDAMAAPAFHEPEQTSLR